MNTYDQYTNIIDKCGQLFSKKTKDYVTSWRILRLPSITDQIYIKAQRIRSIQEAGSQKVEDSIIDEFIGIINYSIIALIQYKIFHDSTELPLEIEEEVVMKYYYKCVDEIKELLFAKNHDYGEAWRNMRVSSITDIILMKLIRIKSIEDNANKTLVSEGVDAGYRDMVNYAVFSLILLSEDEN